MHDPKWSLFFDFHTMPACPDVGKNFDIDGFTDHLRECRVDYVVFPARCNLGMAYYDTKIGIKHPTLEYDLIRRLVDSCHEKGIVFTAYINAGLSHEEGLLHRDWLKVMPEGYVYKPDRMSSFFRQMCYNSPYGDHLVKMVDELVSNYPIDGLFLDCMHKTPCVGVECVREMKEQGMDWNDTEQQYKFALESQRRLARRISEAARAIRKDMLLYFNGVSFEDQAEIGSYLEYECLPTGGWGYESLPLYSRYARNLGKVALNMTGRFHKSWGDFGGIRTEASLEYDCLYGLANGLPPTIGDHFHPRGDRNDAVCELVKKVYHNVQKYEKWYDGAKPLTDMALLWPDGFKDWRVENNAEAAESATGAARMLCEEKFQFDVLSKELSFEQFPLLILPDNVRLDAQAKAKIQKHLESGGKIIASYSSGLEAESDVFAFKQWGVNYKGISPYDPAFIQSGPEIKNVLPNMPVTLYDRGNIVNAIEGTEVLATTVAPFYNRHWDGEHGFVYLPPDSDTGEPAVTLTDSVAYFTHPVFGAYNHDAQIPIRNLVAEVIRRLLPEPLLKLEGLPSFGRATVTAQEERRMVHLLAYVPERRGKCIDMIEEPICVQRVKLALRKDAFQPKKAYLAPDGQELEIADKNGYLEVVVPQFAGYALVVFE